MQQIRDSQSSSGNPLRDDEILSQVLGTRRGHNKGRGRIVSGTSSSSQSTGQSHHVYSQAQVDAMLAQRDAQVAAMLAERDARLQAFEERLNSMPSGQGFCSPPPQTPWNFASSSNFQNATNLETDDDDDDHED